MYGSEQDEDDDVATADEYFSKSDGNDSEGGAKKQKISVYLKHSKYIIVKEVGKVHQEWHLTRREKSDWDIGWFDGPPDLNKILKEIKPW